jgi:hypothetical protein
LIIQEDKSVTRYRYAVLGLLLAGGYFTLVAGTMIRSFFDEADPRGWTLGMDPRDSPLGAVWSAAVGALIVWALWQVARGPARNMPRLSTPFLSGGADGLRRALYWLAGVQLAAIILDDTPFSIFGHLLEIVVSAVVLVLFHRVLTRSFAVFRWIATILGAIGIVSKGTMASWLYFGTPSMIELTLLQPATFAGPAAWMIMILVAQHTDGRWSWSALWPGWSALVAANLLPLVLFGPDALYRLVVASDLAVQLMSVLAATNVFAPVWAVRSAHQLADGAVAGAEPYQGGPDGVDVVDGEDRGEKEGVVAGGDDPGRLGLEGGDTAVDEKRR